MLDTKDAVLESIRRVGFLACVIPSRLSLGVACGVLLPPGLGERDRKFYHSTIAGVAPGVYCRGAMECTLSSIFFPS